MYGILADGPRRAPEEDLCNASTRTILSQILAPTSTPAQTEPALDALGVVRIAAPPGTSSHETPQIHPVSHCHTRGSVS
jgi:hypothetical protein